MHDGITLNNPPAAESSCNALSLWLALEHPKLTLTEEDKKIIFEGDELTDKHINFAQALIKKQFKNIYGLALTFLFQLTEVPHFLLTILHYRLSIQEVIIGLLLPAMDQVIKFLRMIHCSVMSALIQSS